MVLKFLNSVLKNEKVLKKYGKCFLKMCGNPDIFRLSNRHDTSPSRFFALSFIRQSSLIACG